MPPPIAALAAEILKNPGRRSICSGRPRHAVGITQAVYPVPQDLKPALLLAVASSADLVREALVFTRTKHRANRLAEHLVTHKVSAARIHGNRSQAQRTEALAGFKSGKYRVLVATDIAARGIDVEALSHVVNFDVPAVPDDYIHRVGRTGRADATGDAYTFVSPDEETDLRAIERAIGKSLPRVTLPGLRLQGRIGDASSRSRWPSASPRSGPARRATARARRSTPTAEQRRRERRGTVGRLHRQPARSRGPRPGGPQGVVW